MVMLVMTEQLAQAAKLYNHASQLHSRDDQASIKEPLPGDPIIHSEVINIARWLSTDAGKSLIRDKPISTTLNGLLRGCVIYQAPKQEPKEQTNEFKQLMARLRKDEEARSYARMVNDSSRESAGLNGNIGASSRHQVDSNEEDDELTFAEIKRQATLIINVLVSIICTAVFLWIAARRWTIEARLALSMLGALVVAIAEVVIFGGYLRRIKEAKQTERRKVEVKSVESTWIIEGKSKSSNARRRIRSEALENEKD